MTGPTCARCGHQGFLGGTIDGRDYCHSFMASPTCYEQESREQAMTTDPSTGERVHRSLSRDELEQLISMQDRVNRMHDNINAIKGREDE